VCSLRRIMQHSAVGRNFFLFVVHANAEQINGTRVQVSTGYGALYIVILAIDTLTALIHSLARIVDRAAGSGDAGDGGGDGAACGHLADAAAVLHAPLSPAFFRTEATAAAAQPRSDVGALEGSSPQQQQSASNSQRSSSAAAHALAPSPSQRGVLHGSEPSAHTAISGHVTGAAPTATATAASASASGALDTPAATLRRAHDADAAMRGGASTDLRFSLAHASLLAQEQMWADLPPPTEQHARLLVEMLWQPSLEVRRAVRLALLH
jgi:hypothetical protein